MNKAGIDLLKHFEGLNDGDLTHVGLQPKQDCGGIWTVGWGHALRSKTANKFLTGEKDKADACDQYPNMTEQQAEELLQADLAKFEAHVNELVKVEITENQRAALTSFAFNVGVGNLQQSTLLKCVNDENFPMEDAAKHFLDWDKGHVNGKLVVLHGLQLRRQAEMELFLS